MSPALANFLFEAANLLLLSAGLGWVLFKPVRRALDQERERHARQGADQERLRTEAEALVAQARAARETADRETAARRNEILAAAQKEAARIIEQARKAQADEQRTFAQELEISKSEQAAALAETVGRIAGESVRRLLDAVKGPSLDTALVRAACDQLRLLPGAARDSALVECARPLEPEAQKTLAEVLGDGFTARTVVELGAGVRVTLSAGQVDVTLASLARQAARAMTAAAARPLTVAGRADEPADG